MPSTIRSVEPASTANANFSLVPLTPDDAKRCVSIYFDSFQNPHSLACWPRTPAIRHFWEDMVATEQVNELTSHWFKAVHHQSGEIAGFCKWVEPKERTADDEKLPPWPPEADEKLCNETFGEWNRQHSAIMGHRGHWYLEMLSTDPKFQGKGAGSLMLQWGTDMADREGVEAFLEASPPAVPLYEKFGFREAGRTDTFIDNERVKATWYRNLFMVRQPKRKE